MPIVDCRRCNGTGRSTDRDPAGKLNTWCAGCGGDGHVNVADPNAKCARCHGAGRSSDPNPTNNASNWCVGCKGTGYAS